MKKLLLVLAVGAFVACNNSGSSESTSDTTKVTTQDTSTMAPTMSDTTHRDTTNVKHDTTKVKK
jgi:hypothetical protein